MKKHLIAATVAAVFTAPVMAQNVTISGTFDTYVGQLSNGNAAAKSSLLTNGSDGTATSRVIISGVEDLGGGLKAGFTLDNYLTTTTGVDGAVAGGNNRTFDQSFVTLSGGFGSIKAGRTASNASEAWGLGKFAGNLGRIASAQAPYARESDSTVSYTSPEISGLTVELWRANETTLGTGLNDTNAYSGKYANGPFAIAAGYISGKTNANTKQSQTSVAVQYDLGVAKVGYFYVKYDPNTGTANNEVSTNQLHAELPLGNGFRILGTYGMISSRGVADTDNVHFVIGVEKAMSKRTAVYAAYLANDNEAAATFAIRGTTAGLADSDPKSTIVGVRHTF